MTLKNITRAEWLLGELQGRNLHGSVGINAYKKYVWLADGVVFLEEANGQGYVASILTDAGGAVELFFDEEEEEDGY